jgi:O-antigen/teichoic acid export membrane protein
MIYPTLGNNLAPEEFGLLLLLMGIANLLAVTSGNTLNNLFLRLALKKEIGEGSFLITYILSIVFLTGICFVILSLFHVELLLIIQTIIVSILISFRSYFSVEFRVKLNYKNFLIMNLCVAFGYLLGIFLFSTSLSLFPFIVGEVFGSSYIIYKTNLWKFWNFRMRISTNLLKQYFLIIVSGLSINAFTYVDRFLIKPTLGEERIGVFFSAAIMGKLVGLCVGIVSGVFLSYLAKIKEHSFKKYLRRMFIYGFFTILGLFVLIELITPFAIKMLYPKFYTEAMEIHLYVNIGYAFKATEVLIRPIMVRFINLKKFAFLDSSFALLYISFGSLVASNFNLLGFAVFFMLLSVLKSIIQVIIIKIHFSSSKISSNF